MVAYEQESKDVRVSILAYGEDEPAHFRNKRLKACLFEASEERHREREEPCEEEL